ncbi:MAG: alpha/beta hydrolase [Burkholderiaceae bacterium]
MPLASIAARLGLPALAAAGVLSAAGARAQDADRIASRPVPVVVDGRLDVAAAAGRGVLPVHVSRDWSVPQPEVVRAVIVVHGYARDDLRAGEAAMNRAGDGARAAMVVVPQFVIPADVEAHRLPADTLRWNVRDWKSGEPALGPAPLSAFDGLDAIVARLGDRRLFPRLETIVVAGHSAGAQLVQRYAVVGHAQARAGAGVHVRFVVANPSSWLWFDARRPRPAVARGHDGAQACPGVDRWPYGLEGALPPAVDPAIARAPAQAERAYAALDLVTLLGTADVDPDHPMLDHGCAAEAQGATRFERGHDFVAALEADTGPAFAQAVFDVPGVGHTSHGMFTSACGVAALFGVGTCGAPAASPAASAPVPAIVPGAGGR